MFGAKEPVDQSLAGLIAPDPTVTKQDLKRVASCEAMLADLKATQRIRLLVASELFGNSALIAFTDTEIVQVHKRRFGNRIALDEFADIKVMPGPHDTFLVLVMSRDGAMYPIDAEEGYRYNIQFFLRSPSAVRLVDETLVELLTAIKSPPAPGTSVDDSPVLTINPGFYQSILRDTGLPETETNMIRIADVVQSAIAEHIVLAEITERGDQEAAERFGQAFFSSPDAPIGDLDRSDALVGWMLNWDPTQADEVQAMLLAMHSGLTAQDSWLRSVGSEIQDPDQAQS